MIKIDNLFVDYGQHSVLKGLSLKIENATIHGLVGLNGSGKTTLLNTIYGIKKQTEGVVQIMGRERKRSLISYLETQNYFYPRITGKEYLKLISNKNPDFDINAWNDLFELPLKQLIDEYSTGMKKKLAMFGIISQNKIFLILDEPFNGIDLETVYKLKNLLQKLKLQGKTILITSHILESLIGLCDAISYLNNGKIEFTLDKDHFNEVEGRIFSLHQEKIDQQLDKLFKS
jgi:ABC-2 type transport system ATP-binding protein